MELSVFSISYLGADLGPETNLWTSTKIHWLTENASFYLVEGKPLCHV